jgi:hypothetical protein
MKQVEDVMVDTTHDIIIDDAGDFYARASDEQHIHHLLLAGKGSYKTAPVAGVGIVQYINAPDHPMAFEQLRQEIKIQLEYDGYTDINIDGTQYDSLTIDAKRN